MKSIRRIRRSLKKGFTLIEVSMAIALVAIGATVGFLGFRGYNAYASSTAATQNAQNLASAVSQWRNVTNGAITGTGVTAMTVTRANAIYSQIRGALANGQVIVEANFTLPAGATFPATFGETATDQPGVFTPLQ